MFFQKVSLFAVELFILFNYFLRKLYTYFLLLFHSFNDMIHILIEFLNLFSILPVLMISPRIQFLFLSQIQLFHAINYFSFTLAITIECYHYFIFVITTSTFKSLKIHQQISHISFLIFSFISINLRYCCSLFITRLVS
jgi:hypothetical protein